MSRTMDIARSYADMDQVIQRRGQAAEWKRLRGKASKGLRGSDGTLRVRYHDTDVVTWYPDGSVTLNTSGWQTATSRNRIETYSPYRIMQRKGIWYVYRANDPPWTYDDQADRSVEDPAKLRRYYDGITFGPDGQVLADGPDFGAQDRENKAMKGRIDAYVKGMKTQEFWRNQAAAFWQAEAEGTSPVAGDCWDCLFVDQDGTSLGDMKGDHDHLLLHMEEGHYPLTLLVHALNENDSNAIWVLNLIFRDFKDGSDGLGQYSTIWLIPEVCKSVANYLKRRLLTGTIVS